MPFVMCRKSWPAPFNRTVLDGGEKTLLTFAPGEPVEVEQAIYDQLEANGDLAVALQAVTVDEKNRPRPVRDVPAALDPAVSDGELLEAISDDALVFELRRRGFDVHATRDGEEFFASHELDEAIERGAGDKPKPAQRKMTKAERKAEAKAAAARKAEAAKQAADDAEDDQDTAGQASSATPSDDAPLGDFATE